MKLPWYHLTPILIGAVVGMALFVVAAEFIDIITLGTWRWF